MGMPVQVDGMLNATTPQDIFVFFDDFLSCSWATIANGTDEAMKWKSTVIAQAATGLDIMVATASTPKECGGILTLTSEATDNDGENLQAHGSAFAIESGYPLYFESRWRNGDVSAQEFFIGLAIVDAEILTGGCDDRIGFEMLAGELKATAEESANNKTVGCAVTEADASWMRTAFFYDGDDTVHFYVDDTDNGIFEEKATLNISTTTDYIPDDVAMTPTIEAITAESAANVMYVDYVYVAQARYKA
jgi:hypothetical protein